MGGVKELGIQPYGSCTTKKPVCVVYAWESHNDHITVINACSSYLTP